MARTAKQILVAQGYTDAEATEFCTANPRLVTAMEKEDVAIEARYTAEVNDYRNKLTATQKWYEETAVPTIDKALRDATSAKAERARLEAQIKAEQEYGLRRVAGEETVNQPVVNQPNQPNQPNEVDPRYVTNDVFRQTADQVGVAIVMAQDIGDEYRELFGKRIPGGATKLREDFLEARKAGSFSGTMAQFADKQFGFAAKRTELAEKARADERTALETEIRTKIMSEMGNPHTAPGVISRNPFYSKKIEGGSNTGRQPWDAGNGQDRSREQRHAARVSTLVPKVLGTQRTA